VAAGNDPGLETPGAQRAGQRLGDDPLLNLVEMGVVELGARGRTGLLQQQEGCSGQQGGTYERRTQTNSERQEGPPLFQSVISNRSWRGTLTGNGGRPQPCQTLMHH